VGPMGNMTAWDQLLTVDAHRPFPLPLSRWAVTMIWEDLLFAHWPIPGPEMRAIVPPSLELDTWDAQAWIGVVPFRMRSVGPRRLNGLPWVSAFPELNVRTYVRNKGKAGVYFFSLDAGNWLAALTARVAFKLPYFWARMACKKAEGISYTSERLLGPAAAFSGSYAPTGEPRRAQPGSFEHWLVERYCLHTTDSSGNVHCGDIHHPPWPLQNAEAEIVTNTMLSPTGLALPHVAPVLHFVKRLDVVAWALTPS
jgi:uncharacterized protein